jgi:hypothetical protein
LNGIRIKCSKIEKLGDFEALLVGSKHPDLLPRDRILKNLLVSDILSKK